MIFLYGIIFLLFLILIIYPLGRCLLNFVNIEITKTSAILLSLVLGFWGITLEAYLLGLTGFRNFLVIFIILQSIILISILLKSFKLNFNGIAINYPVVFVILLSIFINSLITFPFGTFTDQGITLTGVHMSDSNWHLSLINSLLRSTPPDIPTFSGVSLKNYHYLVDLQIATVQLLTRIPLPLLFYKIIGPFYIVLYSCMAFLVGKLLTKKDLGGILLVLYSALSSNWYYLARVFYPAAYNWPSVAWIDFFSSKSVNYPLLFSLIMLFLIIYLFSAVKNKDFKFILLVSLIIGSLMPIKSHTGIVVISSFFVLGIWQIIKRDFLVIKISILSTIAGGMFILPTIDIRQSFLVFYPLWFIKVMYEASDRMNFPEWELRRQFLLSKGGYLGLLKLYTQGLLIFTLINLNILLLGVGSILQRFENQYKKTIILLGIITINSYILTMLFIYRGIAIITIQFFYPAIISLSILLVIWIMNFHKKHKFSALFVAFIIWISFLPGVIFTLNQYYGKGAGAVGVPVADAIRFLAKLPQGVTLVDSAYSGNSLIAAYTDKSIFYADDLTLDTLTVDYSDRKNATLNFFGCKNNKEMQKFILDNNIKYIFSAHTNCLDDLSNLRRVFSNNTVSIYQSSI